MAPEGTPIRASVGQPIAWVNTFPNMHTGPSGNQVWEDCPTREAGVGHLQGGPGGHYWTLDVGTK
jgi:hypothetical protein